jgi:hypothetical protein
MASVQRLATSALLLERGRLIGSGKVRPVVAQYLGGHSHAHYRAAHRTGRPQFLDAHLVNERGQPVARCLNTDAFGFRVRYVLPRAQPGVKLGIGVQAADGTVVFTSETDDVSIDVPSDPLEYEAIVMIPADTLLAGDYHLSLRVWDAGDLFDHQEPALSFSLEHGPSVLYASGTDRKGFVHVRCEWTVDRAMTAP